MPPEYSIPSVIEEVTKVMLYHRKNGVWLNPTVWERCHDTEYVSGIGVGGCADGTLHIDDCGTDTRHEAVGVAVSRFPFG